MGFKSIDEIQHFSFRDCQIVSFACCEEEIKLQVEALIVTAQNSQNTNFTDSYAGLTTIRLVGGRITSGFKEGYKYYDANDRLIQEVPDCELDISEMTELVKGSQGAYLFAMEEKDVQNGKKHCAIGIEFADDSDYGSQVSDTYQLDIDYERAIMTWEQYMNRVQGY